MSSLQMKVLKYSTLPGFIPRIGALFSSGFVHISYLMAFIYGSLRLIPPNHPYLNPANRGRFGIRHVIAEAANNLVFSKKNIDQIIIFFTVLLGIILLAVQFGLFIMALIFQHDVIAATVASYPSFTDILRVDSIYGHGDADGAGAQDIAFIILDQVFGTRGIFNSCVALTGVDCLNMQNMPLQTLDTYPTTFHTALHAMLEFYSIGIFLVSVIVILYFFITLTAETAATGSPFGQRANRAWAPVRLIVFAAMLVPLGEPNAGLNAAQLITLWTAKTGSNFATNGWGYFNESFTDTRLNINIQEMVGRPTTPEAQDIMKFIFLARTCSFLEQKITREPIDAYVISANTNVPARLGEIEFFFDAVDLADEGNIEIVIGNYNPDNSRNQKYKNNVYPACGKMVINTINSSNATSLSSIGVMVEIAYYELVRYWWQGNIEMRNFANCFVKQRSTRENVKDCTLQNESDFKSAQAILWDQYVRNAIGTNVDIELASYPDNSFEISQNLMTKGWAGAALWYNQITELNGSLVTAVQNSPTIAQYPMVMENVMSHQLNQSENLPGIQTFNPRLSEQNEINYERTADEDSATVLYAAYKMWEIDSYTDSNFSQSSSSPIIDFLNYVLGTSGIFDMRENADVHPLAQLSSLGRGMMEATIRNLGVGTAMQGFGRLFKKGTPLAEWEVIGSALWTVGLSLLIMSVILYYIIPFLPFIYFLFAVSGWVKSIFEAMVAMPLWAMAHIRIDGEGIPGRDASNGYFLLMEIFLRPILIVFGLLSSIIVFSSMVKVLNQIFDLVVTNVGGANMENQVQNDFADFADFLRGPIDELFFTALYVIIVYMIALACFKLVDLIPNNILRWSGVSVSTFQEGAGDPAGQITGSVYTGGTLMTGRISGGALAALV